jgi:hypothetical protein
MEKVLLCKQGENNCRFTGKLVDFAVREVGQDKYKLGKGKLLLPDPDFQYNGQYINIMAWEELAQRLEKVNKDSWISVFGAYTPSEYAGKIQDYFTINGFVIIP